MTLNPICADVETKFGVPLTVTGVAQVHFHALLVMNYGSFSSIDVVFFVVLWCAVVCCDVLCDAV